MDEVARKLRRLADAAAAPYCTYRPDAHLLTLRKRLLKMNLEQLIAELGTEDDDEHSEGTRDEDVDEEDAGEEDEDADEDADEEADADEDEEADADADEDEETDEFTDEDEDAAENEYQEANEANFEDYKPRGRRLDLSQLIIDGQDN